ncbi:adenylate/guanylate cyclase domain-containing protein [Anaerovorax odorimutans]|uniref:adenylate/guanylate cyclase domain-containing protein n=1 Tax=Anaerovorax odorimutans TaxID=109327 RepID=UPI00041B8838|nr:adenylate/guanylate cyclase domain-containing protein [Anaerovorax odorimutans]
MKSKKSIYVVMAVITFIIFSFFMDYFIVFQNMIYDNIYESKEEISDDIIIVGIDNMSYEKLGRWPYSRDVQSEIFEKILKDKPAVLGIDIIYDSKTNDSDDLKLINTLKGNPVVSGSILVSGMEKWGYTSENTYITPFGELDNIITTGFVNPQIDSKDNGVIRKTVLSKTFNKDIYNSFSYEIYRKYVLHNNINANFNKFDNKINKSLYINYAAKPMEFKNISAYLVYNNMIPEGFFEDKIVLFGPYSLGMQDEYPTTIDKDEKMFGIEVHANIIQDLINDSFKKDLNGSIDLILIVLTGFISFIILRKTKPSIAFLLNIFIIIAYIIFGKYLYSKGFIFQVIYPIVTVLIIYIITLIYNYIEQMLERKRITGIFGKYVAPQIVNKVLEDGEESLKLGGIRKYISVLFVDIRDFTTLSEKAEPEEVVEILNEYLDLCSKSIFNNGGTLDKFIGDAAMAIFNAPFELNDHAFCAIKTAWEMKQGAEFLKEKIQKKYDRTVQFGIGINTGYAVIGNIGSKERMDYTAIGDTVNTSARLESNAKAGQILISKETYELVKDKVLVTPLGGIMVKGKTEEIEVYQIDGIKI